MPEILFVFGDDSVAGAYVRKCEFIRFVWMKFFAGHFFDEKTLQKTCFYRVENSLLLINVVGDKLLEIYWIYCLIAFHKGSFQFLNYNV